MQNLYLWIKLYFSALSTPAAASKHTQSQRWQTTTWADDIIFIVSCWILSSMFYNGYRHRHSVSCSFEFPLLSPFSLGGGPALSLSLSAWHFPTKSDETSELTYFTHSHSLAVTTNSLSCCLSERSASELFDPFHFNDVIFSQWDEGWQNVDNSWIIAQYQHARRREPFPYRSE